MGDGERKHQSHRGTTAIVIDSLGPLSSNEKKISCGHWRQDQPADEMNRLPKAFLNAEQWPLASSSG
jgi:hypothetical protein